MIEWNSIEPLYWGLKTYQEAEALQIEAFEKVKAGHPGFLLGGEVEFVVTQGIRGKREHLLEQNLKAIETRRGGETTLHSPGQLVLYPVVNLHSWGLGAKEYVHSLLKISRETFLKWGLECEIQDQAVGLWTPRGKLGFCGVQIRGGITQHGLALNLKNDLSLFRAITSCGIQNGRFDKLEFYRPDVSLERFFQDWESEARQIAQGTDRDLRLSESSFQSTKLGSKSSRGVVGSAFP